MFAWRQTLAARGGQGLKINSEEGHNRCKQVDWGLGWISVDGKHLGARGDFKLEGKTYVLQIFPEFLC